MKTKNLHGATYQSPELAVLEIKSEGVLCASGDNKWYDEGGEGNFDYGVGNDDTWA